MAVCRGVNQRSGIVTPMVGLLTTVSKTWFCRRLMDEGRIETETTGSKTQAALDFSPRLGRESLVSGYRKLMQELYKQSYD